MVAKLVRKSWKESRAGVVMQAGLGDQGVEICERLPVVQSTPGGIATQRPLSWKDQGCEESRSLVVS